ncbi:MAG TPA: hypothetical protein VK196_03920, partial [Magnetospirillum sp.]|nr:hypothetical protein [Magnetospirillum sp.]
MTDIPVSTGGAVAPGQVSFLNACLPPLTAGAYSLNWSQSVTGVGSTPPPPYTGDQPFIVSGPRFTLPGSTVQSVYPPAGKSGTFGDSLAHVVLSRATLPWERQPAPWLALLLVGNGDIPDGLDTTTVTELLTPAQGVVVPAIALDDLLPGEADSRCNSVELDAKLFAGLAPTADELPYLCHGREVAVDNKVEAAASADGRYAVVIGNRVVPAKLAVDTAFTALLVSLEGHMDHLPAYGGDGTTPVAPPQVANADRVRLCVLASWSFTASASAGSFSGLMKNLSRPGGIDMLQYPHDAQVGEPLAQKALDIGFVPLVHNTRSGEQTTSWYRGPLAPCPTNPAAVEPALFSDALLRYDPGTGLFDTSYA